MSAKEQGRKRPHAVVLKEGLVDNLGDPMEGFQSELHKGFYKEYDAKLPITIS